MASLSEIRAKLLEKENKLGGNFSGAGANEIYAFWNIPEGSTATLRFLPDGNTNNPFFWQERLIIRLPFEGIVGQPDAKNVIVQVPCVEMWDKTCPILSEVRGWFKDPDLEALGRKYWKKRSFIFQGFVVNDPMEESDAPENPIRRFVINRSIYEIIKASLMDSEMEELPIDYQAGRDFKLTKTKRGQYADYSTSNWSMRTRSLSDSETEAIDNFGLFDLKDYLPKEPSERDLEIISEMFQASVDGEPYDPDKWSAHYKPNGFRSSENNTSGTTSETTSTNVKKATKKVEEAIAEVAEEVAEEVPNKKSAAALDKIKKNVAKSKSDDRNSTSEEDLDAKDNDAKDSAKPDHSQILDMIKKRRQSS